MPRIGERFTKDELQAKLSDIISEKLERFGLPPYSWDDLVMMINRGDIALPEPLRSNALGLLEGAIQVWENL